MASFSSPRHDSWAERGRAVGLGGLSSTSLAVNGGVSVLPWWLRRLKNLPCNARNPGSIPESGRSPGEGNGNPLQYSCLENPYGQRSLPGYSPWRRKESDMTERLTISTNMGVLTAFYSVYLENVFLRLRY